MNNIPEPVIEAYFNLTALTAELLKSVDDDNRPQVLLALGTLMGTIGQYIFKDIEAIKEAHKTWGIKNPELTAKPKPSAEA